MSLATNYLAKVSVAEHDGLVRQILGKLQASGISNEMFLQRLTAYAARVEEEDEAYRQSQKDFDSDRLKDEDSVLDMYVKAVRAILNGHAEIPAAEPNHQLAIELIQVFKDYKFSPSDTYTAEADKVRNMNQVFQGRLADLETLGVKDYWTQAVARAANVEQLLSQRFNTIAAQQVGAVKTARANTDQALKAMYELLSAMNVMMPSTALTDLIAQLDAIESYACQYYLSGKKPSANSGNAASGNQNQNDNENQNNNNNGNNQNENNNKNNNNNDNNGNDNPGGDDNGNDNPNPNPGGDDPIED
ncbi:MAG: hypothetical protein J6W52_02605 [Bacteroidaceae bacterium]|nr:hypothetical protein [Bacteroidaceae bacterium]